MAETERHLLIDGYNVIHSWTELKERFEDGGEVARARLLEAVRVLHDVENLRVTVVFDGRGDHVEIERPGEDLTFSVIFSPRDLSADGVIEQLVGASADPSRLQVVTRDNLERETIEALGASGLHPDELRDWIRRCEMKLAEKLRDKQYRVEKAWSKPAQRRI